MQHNGSVIVGEITEARDRHSCRLLEVSQNGRELGRVKLCSRDEFHVAVEQAGVLLVGQNPRDAGELLIACTRHFLAEYGGVGSAAPRVIDVPSD